MSQLTKAKEPPPWHAEAIGKLRENLSAIDIAFMSAARKAVWLGLFLHGIKERGKADKSIPHGQFWPWLRSNLPDAKERTLSQYLTIGSGIAEQAKIKFAKLANLPLWENPGALPDPVEKLIEGKNQQALFLEFKQAEEIEEGVLAPKRGRRKGEGGNSAEHLAAVKAAEEKARIDNLTIEFKERRLWLLENCGPEGLGKIPDQVADDFIEAMQTIWPFCRQLRSARQKGGAK